MVGCDEFLQFFAAGFERAYSAQWCVAGAYLESDGIHQRFCRSHKAAGRSVVGINPISHVVYAGIAASASLMVQVLVVTFEVEAAVGRLVSVCGCRSEKPHVAVVCSRYLGAVFTFAQPLAVSGSFVVYLETVNEVTGESPEEVVIVNGCSGVAGDGSADSYVIAVIPPFVRLLVPVYLHSLPNGVVEAFRRFEG